MSLGTPFQRVDATAKVSGRARYTDDFSMPGMRHAKYVRSTVSHAFVTAIDIDKALQLTGVDAIFTFNDVPQHDFPTAGHAWSLDANKRDIADRQLLTHHVRHFGDPVAIVVACDALTAEKAVSLVEVTYQPLPVMISAATALAENATPIHHSGNLLKQHAISVNQPDEAIARATIQLEKTYYTPAVQHCHMETVISFAYMEKLDHITIVSSTQIPHVVRRTVAQALNLPWSNIRVIKPCLGGGFGNKQDVLEEPMVAFLTMKLGGIPVKIELSREENFYGSRTRHAFDSTVKLGLDNTGNITGYTLDVLSNTGAYASHGHSIVAAGGNKISYLYPRAAFGYAGKTFYSNLPCAGAMRGYGAPQVIFALESMVDDAALLHGIDPVELRIKNVARLGDINPVNKKEIKSAGLIECLERGRTLFQWDKRRKEYAVDKGNIRRGIGVACFSYGSNTYPVGVEIAGARLLINQDGTINLQIGATEIGQGSDTVFAQMVAETLSVPTEMVRTISTQDTDSTAFDPGAFASRQSYVTAPAVREASLELRSKILTHAAYLCKEHVNEITLKNGNIVSLSKPDEILCSLADVSMSAHYDQEVGGQLLAEVSHKTRSNPPAFGCTFVDLTVDISLCKVTINRILNLHDSGRILNPQLAEGQVHGGMGMAVGWALFEEMLFDQQTGVVLNPNLLDYKFPTILDLPDLECEFVETYEPQSAYGHKALGEPPIISPAPAIRNAILMATGIAIDSIPITPKALFRHFVQAGLIKE